MRAVLAVLCVLVGAKQGLGQFEVLTAGRRVEISHPDTGTMRGEGGITPRLIEVGPPNSSALPYASQEFWYDADNITSNAWVRRKLSLPNIESGTAESYIGVNFNVLTPVLVNFSCSTGWGDIQLNGVSGVILPCDGEGAVYRNVALDAGSYQIEMSILANDSQPPTWTGRVASFNLQPIPEPSTWIIAAIVLCLAAIHQLSPLIATASKISFKMPVSKTQI